jgi:hypothetical protein
MDHFFEKLIDFIIGIALLFVIWVAVDTIDWVHNPHHSLNKSFNTIWHGYR